MGIINSLTEGVTTVGKTITGLGVGAWLIGAVAKLQTIAALGLNTALLGGVVRGTSYALKGVLADK